MDWDTALTGPLDVLGGIDDGAAYKAPCKVATIADMTGAMIGLPVIDGYQTISGDRVLVRANTSATTNGIYVAQLGGWCRAIDFTNSSAIAHGTQVLVANGTTYAGCIFQCQADAPIIGTAAITFTVSRPTWTSA